MDAQNVKQQKQTTSKQKCSVKICILLISNNIQQHYLVWPQRMKVAKKVF
jgi:hypothetical protein